MSRIAVVGVGYLGATHAAAMAELGHSVVGIDSDANKVAGLNRAEPPFFEPGLAAILSLRVADGSLRFTTDPAAVADADHVFICVGTPQLTGSDRADLGQVFAAVAAVAPHLPAGARLIGKSTVPVGTAADVAAAVRGIAPADVRVLWNPEFLREGMAVADTLRPDRIVVGANDPRDAEPLRELYAAQIEAGAPFLVTDYATAELVKMAANSFLATKISFINAMADVCAATGADVTALAEAIGYDERIGARFLQAGIGFGGGCLPKDLRAFMARGNELGVGRSLAFLREVDEINMRRRQTVVQSAREMLSGAPLGARVAVLGVAFKPDSDDVRDSPALSIAAALHLQGCDVVVYDPRAMANAAQAYPTLTFAPDVSKALADADLVLLLTEWDEFLALDPAIVGANVRHRRIIDGRNRLDRAAWRAAGWEYRGIGIP